ncbi:MAG: fibronectin/fibrinogen-binding protein [Ruminococcaceae bacterium]|nr:fibronectin/fibrinogen-binding protein [Oscillospiraceae bacterium]
MALDGIYLHFLKNELKEALIGAKAEKIYQPTKNELVIALRTRQGAYKLFLSCSGNSSRVNLTDRSPDNPQKPPMLCMLLRKYLQGATLSDIRQQEFDRILFFDFDAVNEIGDKIKLCLVSEIMAQHSNIILVNGEGKIIDAFRRLDDEQSVREVLPGGTYVLPPLQSKENILSCDIKAVCEIIGKSEKLLSKELLNVFQGFSPLVCRELASLVTGSDKAGAELTFSELDKLENELMNIRRLIETDSPIPFLLTDSDSKPFDFSYMPINQYSSALNTQTADSLSELLDDFFFERDRVERTKKRAGDLYKTLTNAVERTARRINNQTAELKECENKEQLRVFGELITANQYSLEKGVAFYELPNYYDNNNPVKIPVNPAFSPQKNAQKYYKDYKKAHTAEKMLASLISEGKTELAYLESVLDSLSRAETEAELAAIRSELVEGGYVKNRKTNKQMKQKELSFIEYTTSDGFRVAVGRNNVQNDKLTFKTANNHDMWLHVQGFAGSHTVIFSDRKEITDTAILEAASIAAFHSKARDLKNVPVDYTLIKNIKKPNGSPYGFVVYYTYNTVIVDPKGE